MAAPRGRAGSFAAKLSGGSRQMATRPAAVTATRSGLIRPLLVGGAIACATPSDDSAVLASRCSC